MRNYLGKDIKLFIVIVILLIINSSYGYKSVEELVLIEDGTSKSNIILGKEPSQVEKFSANELQKYLKEITGVTLPIKEEITTQSKASIIVGMNNYTKSIDLSEEKLGSDGFVIKRDGSNLILVGREERGTLYSVYAFLEHLGCRFFAPGFAHYNGNHELIPKKKTISVGNLNIVEKPGFAVRMEHALQIGRGRLGKPEDLSLILDWMAKNRLNILQTSLTFATEEVYEESRRALRQRGLSYASGSHDDWRQCLPIEDYGEEHPEWFARTTDGIFIGEPGSGVRGGSSGAPCSSNPEALKALADKYLQLISDRPFIDIVIPFQPDGFWYCRCEDCLELEGEEENVLGKQTAIKRYLSVISPIVTRMNEQFPNKLVVPILYNPTNDVPPQDFDLTPFKRGNLAIWWVNWTRDWSYPLNVSTDINPVNQSLFQGMKAWQQEGIPVVNESHYVKYRFRSWPAIHTQLIYQDYRDHKEINGFGVSLFDAAPENWYTFELNHYVHARCAWNPNLDIGLLLNDYYQNRYGEAWEPMKEYFTHIEDALHLPHDSNERMCPGTYPPDPINSIPRMLEFLKKAKKALQTAIVLTKDQDLLNLIEKNHINLRYVTLDLQGMYYEKLFEKNSNIEDLERSVQAEEELIELFKEHSGKGIILIDHGSFQNHHTAVFPRLARNSQILESLKNPDPTNLALAGNGGKVISAPDVSGELGWGKEGLIDGVVGGDLFETFELPGKRIPHFRIQEPSEPVSIEIKLSTTDFINRIRIWQVDESKAEKVTIKVWGKGKDYEMVGNYKIFAQDESAQEIKFSPRKADKVKLEFNQLVNPSTLGIIEVEVYSLGSDK